MFRQVSHTQITYKLLVVLVYGLDHQLIYKVPKVLKVHKELRGLKEMLVLLVRQGLKEHKELKERKVLKVQQE